MPSGPGGPLPALISLRRDPAVYCVKDPRHNARVRVRPRGATDAAPSGSNAHSPPRHIDFLLVGGGVASAVAAETLRAEGAAGSILILSQEDVPPYHRPPLSKQMLLDAENEQQIFVHPESFYRDKPIRRDEHLTTPSIRDRRGEQARD